MKFLFALAVVLCFGMMVLSVLTSILAYGVAIALLAAAAAGIICAVRNH